MCNIVGIFTLKCTNWNDDEQKNGYKISKVMKVMKPDLRAKKND